LAAVAVDELPEPRLSQNDPLAVNWALSLSASSSFSFSASCCRSASESVFPLEPFAPEPLNDSRELNASDDERGLGVVLLGVWNLADVGKGAV